MVMSGLALRSTAMCLLVWSAYIWPGQTPPRPCLMAAWVSVKIVALVLSKRLLAPWTAHSASYASATTAMSMRMVRTPAVGAEDAGGEYDGRRGPVEAGRRDSNSRAGAWHGGCDEAMATSRMTTSRTESRMASRVMTSAVKLRKKGVTYCTSYPATTLANHEEKSRKLINRDCMTKDSAATDSGLGMGTILNPPNRRHLAVLVPHPTLAVLTSPSSSPSCS